MSELPAAVPSVPAGGAPEGGLSDRDRRVLELEARTFRRVGSKERAIREEIGMSSTAYYVRVNRLLDEPAALRAAPALVHRLRARRSPQDAAVRDAQEPGRVA